MQGAFVQRHIPQIRSQVQQWRAQGLSVGFVPTMGALHRGHATLILRAKEQCARVVVSIFVNPTQFGPSEDFAKYPRTFDKDYDVVTACGADMVFLPEVQEIYPAGHATQVQVQGLTDCLCGAARPGHFSGVALVVSMLLNIVRPDMSFLGKRTTSSFRSSSVCIRICIWMVASWRCRPCVRGMGWRCPHAINISLARSARSPQCCLRPCSGWADRTLHGVPYLVELGRERILAAVLRILIIWKCAMVNICCCKIISPKIAVCSWRHASAPRA